MAEHHEEFGSGGPPPEPSTEDHLGNPDLGAPIPASAPGEFAPPSTGGSPGQPEAHESAFKHPHPAFEPEVPDVAPNRPFFPMLIGAAMLAALAAAWVVTSKPAESSGTETPPEAVAVTPAPEPTAAEPAPGTGVKSSESEIEGFRTELKALQGRIEAMPKPAPPPDLEPINSKIADLAKSSETVAALPKKMSDLDERVAALDKSIADLKGEVEALASEFKKAAAVPPEEAKVDDSALNQGLDLFKAGKYKEASAAFFKLTETNPNDARVWYYAALSRGSATKEWRGETVRLMEKGVELEKAGTPATAKIDSAFGDLIPSLKPWLDGYRKMAKPR